MDGWNEREKKTRYRTDTQSERDTYTQADEAARGGGWPSKRHNHRFTSGFEQTAARRESGTPCNTVHRPSHSPFAAKKTPQQSGERNRPADRPTDRTDPSVLIRFYL